MMSDTFATEPWTYTVDGVDYEGRKVWHVPTPGPVGCGVMYHESDARDSRADDEVWERHIYKWVRCSDPCPQPDCERKGKRD